MKRALVLLAALALVVTAVAYAAGGKKAAPTSSERVSLTITLSGGELSHQATVRLDGAVDNARRVATGTVDLSQLDLPVKSADGAIDASHGLVLYAKVPLLAQIVAGGKPWVSVDAGALARAQGVDLAPLTTLLTSPQQFVATLRGLTAGTTTIGSESVDGVQTTHERLTIDVRKLATLVPEAQRADAAQCIEAAIAAGAPATVDVDVWTDATGLLRRATYSFTDPEDGGSAAVDARFRDYGSAQPAKLPSASQVTDLTHLLQGR